jgi:hypothetical protein
MGKRSGIRVLYYVQDAKGGIRYEAGRRVAPGSDRAGRFYVALFAE